MFRLLFPLVWVLKKSRSLSALACRLTKWTGKSQFAVHPKHLLASDEVWYLGGIEKKDLVLDLGCGNGQHTLKTALSCRRIIGLDYDNSQLGLGRQAAKKQGVRNISFKKLDLENKLPFKEGQFDKVLALDILEHLNNREEFLKEIKRVLKPEGLLFITVPNKNTGWKKLQRRVGIDSVTDPDHKVEYSLEESKSLFQGLGFKVLSLKPIVLDTPFAGFIDLVGGITLKSYQKLVEWKKSKVENDLKESIGFRLKMKPRG